MGDGEFVERIVDQEEKEEVFVKKIGYEELKERVVKEMGIEEKELTKTGKSTKEGKKLRAVLSYMAVQYGKERLVNIAERYQISRQAVGQLVKRGEEIVEDGCSESFKEVILK